MPNVVDNRRASFIPDELVFDEIRAIVAEAMKKGGVLHIASHVERLATTYRTSTFSKGRIADEMILAASRAKVPVEMAHAP
jgi:hypothetical protein